MLLKESVGQSQLSDSSGTVTLRKHDSSGMNITVQSWVSDWELSKKTKQGVSEKELESTKYRSATNTSCGTRKARLQSEASLQGNPSMTVSAHKLL